MTWTSDELDQVDGAEELELTVGDRTRTIWVVRVGDNLYIRSWRGTGGAWYGAAQQARAARIHAGGIDRNVALVDAPESVNDRVDDAYRTKYARYLDSYTAHMIAPQTRATTLMLEPE